jgi:hypothetical protein
MIERAVLDTHVSIESQSVEKPRKIKKKAPVRIHGQGLYAAQATLPDQALIGPR